MPFNDVNSNNIDNNLHSITKEELDFDRFRLSGFLPSSWYICNGIWDCKCSECITLHTWTLLFLGIESNKNKFLIRDGER